MSVINGRIRQIREVIKRAELEIINPLRNIDNNTETENFLIQRKDGRSEDSRSYLNKRTMNFYNVINQLKAKIEYIKSGGYGTTFKGIIEKDEENREDFAFAVKIVAYPKKEGYGSVYNVERPENAEICMLKTLSYFVIKNQTPHLILPICTFYTSIKPFLTLQEEEVVPKTNEKYKEFVENYNKGIYHEHVSVIISEWANRGDLGMFLKKNYKKLELIHWQSIFFQIISTLAIIQNKYPSFRHNDLKPNNILVSKLENCKFKTSYKVGGREYILPQIGYTIYIWDFDFACIPDVVDNSKVKQEWTNKINIIPKRNQYYDIHYFFCSLTFKGFLPEILTDEVVPKEVKEFINYVIPDEYKPIEGSKYTDKKKCRLIKDVELYKPVEILEHKFFEIFRNK
jgi:serine/threonine protein kinase